MTNKKKIATYISVVVIALVIAIALVVTEFLSFDSKPPSTQDEDEWRMMEEVIVTGSAIRDSNVVNILIEEVDRYIKDMRLANVVFNAPTTLNIEESFLVNLEISLQDDIEQLKKNVSDMGEQYSALISVSDSMEARLTGADFEINAITREVQPVSNIANTEWKWNIQPKKEGESTLHLTLTALINLEDRESAFTVRTFDRNIVVTITPVQKIQSFALDHWEWLCTAIFLPIIGWLVKKHFRLGE